MHLSCYPILSILGVYVPLLLEVISKPSLKDFSLNCLCNKTTYSIANLTCHLIIELREAEYARQSLTSLGLF
jgi:hypothetical protein